MVADTCMGRIVAQLTGNPHVLKPTSRDWDVRPPSSLVPLFQPPPPSFPRSIYLSSTSPSSASSEPFSSSQGQFSLSLKGVRKSLLKLVGKQRGDGGRVGELVECLERELRSWLDARRGDEFHSTSKILNSTPFDLSTLTSSEPFHDLPDLPSRSTPAPKKTREEPTLTELSRSPNALQWLLPDPHARFLTHVLARYYSLPSFSKPLLLPGGAQSGRRVTWILKPRVAIVNRGSPGIGESPPTTEVEATSTEGETETETETEVGSSLGEESERESVGGDLESVDGVLEAAERRKWELEMELEMEMEMGGGREDGEERDYSDEDDDDDEAYDSSTMGDSIGSLPSNSVAMPVPSRLATSTLAEDSTPRQRSPAFFPVTPSTPLNPSHLSLDSTPIPNALPTSVPRTGRPRTSNPAPSVRDSSESSIERAAPAARGGRGKVGGGGRREEWKFPEKTFGEFLWGDEQ